MSCRLRWSRPMDKAPYPHIWAESADSAKLLKYWIQVIPEDKFEDAIEHLVQCYLQDEPWSIAAGMRPLNIAE